MTPFKQGRNDGAQLSCRRNKYKGRKKADYLSGVHKGVISAILAKMDAEIDPVNTVTDVGELKGS